MCCYISPGKQCLQILQKNTNSRQCKAQVHYVGANGKCIYKCTGRYIWQVHYICAQEGIWQVHYICAQEGIWQVHYICAQEGVWQVHCICAQEGIWQVHCICAQERVWQVHYICAQEGVWQLHYIYMCTGRDMAGAEGICMKESVRTDNWCESKSIMLLYIKLLRHSKVIAKER